MVNSYKNLEQMFISLSQCVESKELRDLINTQNIDLFPSNLITTIPERIESGKEEIVPEKPTGRASVYTIGVEHEKYPLKFVWVSDIHFFGGQVIICYWKCVKGDYRYSHSGKDLSLFSDYVAAP
jgi:hypothetical protein